MGHQAQLSSTASASLFESRAGASRSDVAASGRARARRSRWRSTTTSTRTTSLGWRTWTWSARVASRDTRRRRDPRATATRSGPARTARRAAAGATPRTARRSRADIPSGEASPGRFRGHRTTTATARSLPRSPTMTTTTSISSARPPATTVPTPRRPATTTSSPRVRPSRPHTWECVASRAEATPPPPPAAAAAADADRYFLEEALGSSAAARETHGVDDLATAPAKIPTRRHQEEHGEDERRGGGGASSRGGAIESLRVHRGGVGGARPIGGVDARRLRVRARRPFRVDASARRPTDAHAAHIPIDGREDEGR